MMVRINKETRSPDSLQEFLVKNTTESARVGQISIVFHLDIETIMLRFPTPDVARKFVTMVTSIRSVVYIQTDWLRRHLKTILIFRRMNKIRQLARD